MHFDGTCVETLHLFRGPRRGRVAGEEKTHGREMQLQFENRDVWEQDGATSSRRFNVGDESRADLIRGSRAAPQPLAETLLVKEARRA